MLLQGRKQVLIQTIKESGTSPKLIGDLIDAMIEEYHNDMETVETTRCQFFQGRIDALRAFRAYVVDRI